MRPGSARGQVRAGSSMSSMSLSPLRPLIPGSPPEAAVAFAGHEAAVGEVGERDSDCATFLRAPAVEAMTAGAGIGIDVLAVQLGGGTGRDTYHHPRGEHGKNPSASHWNHPCRKRSVRDDDA